MARRALAFDGPPGQAKKNSAADLIQLEAERLRQAMLEKLKQESEEQNRKAEMELRKKARSAAVWLPCGRRKRSDCDGKPTPYAAKPRLRVFRTNGSRSRRTTSTCLASTSSRAAAE